MRLSRFSGLVYFVALPVLAQQTPMRPAFADASWVQVAGQDCWAHIRPSIANAALASGVTWTGGCIGQQLSGNGILTVTLASRPLAMNGIFARGELNGQGSIDWPDGAHRDGAFTDSLLNGIGVRRTAAGLHYTGNFVNGVETGQGRAEFPNGLVDEGQFAGAPNGPGTMSFGGMMFEGIFHHSFTLDGPVVLHRADGTAVKGDLKMPTVMSAGVPPLNSSVMVYTMVLENGQPDATQAFAQDGPDKKANQDEVLRLFKTWQFSPALFAGKPIAVPYMVKLPGRPVSASLP